MPETDAVTSTIQNQLPPRTTTSHRWPRKWATLGGRGSTLPPQIRLDEPEKVNGNGHRHSTSLFRKSSTISRTNGTLLTTENPSLTKSRSLINVLRSKLNSPAVLRRFRTKSRESSKQVITEIPEKSRKRDPSPMKRLTSRLAQLTRSSTHTSIETEVPRKISPSPPPTSTSLSASQNQDQVDQINACYDEIRAKYFDNKTTLASLPTDRLKEMLSTTTTSSIDYYDRPNGDIHNRSLSTISMNGSLLSHEFLNNSQQYVSLSSSPPKPTVDDPALQARKQSNIKLNCMLSGYGFKTPFGNQQKADGEHDIFKFHHYHDVGKRKFEWNNVTNNSNRLYSSLRTRPISRSIDSFRPTENIDTENSIEHEDSEIKTCSSKIHVQPAVTPQVKAFISSTNGTDDYDSLTNGKLHDDEFERNFLRAVDRALGVSNKDDQPLYDTPMKIEQSDMNLVEITERALSAFKNTEFLMNDERKEEQNDTEHQTNGTESPNVELFDRTGEFLDPENLQWQSSAVYDHQEESNPVWSVVDDLTRKTQDLVYDEPQNGREFLVKLDEEERMIKSKADVYNKLLQSDDNRLTEEIRSDINAAIGEVNLLLRGKLKQFRGLCQANVMKSTTSAGEPTPLDSDLEGFWDITYPLIDKVKLKFGKLDVQKAKQWAPIEDEYDPNDVNNRPRIIDDRLKQLQPHQNKAKISNPKTGNDDLKKLIQERRKAAANASNQNHDVEIFVAQK